MHTPSLISLPYTFRHFRKIEWEMVFLHEIVKFPCLSIRLKLDQMSSCCKNKEKVDVDLVYLLHIIIFNLSNKNKRLFILIKFVERKY